MLVFHCFITMKVLIVSYIFILLDAIDYILTFRTQFMVYCVVTSISDHPSKNFSEWYLSLNNY